jgi:hypothetical protein
VHRNHAFNSSIFTSKLFVAGLLLLLLNDHYLKAEYHNWLTGKLSDFAGLFIFPLFISAFLPGLKPLIYFFTAASFILWKTEAAQPLIDFANSINIPLDRTVDYSDFIALSVLPFSFFYDPEFSVPVNLYRQLLVGSIGIASFFTFSATSMKRVPTFDVNEKYRINKSKTVLIDDILKLDCEFSIDTSFHGEDTVYAIRNLKSGNDLILMEVVFSLKERKRHTIVKILRIRDKKLHNFTRSPSKFRKKLTSIAETYVIEAIE